MSKSEQATFAQLLADAIGTSDDTTDETSTPGSNTADLGGARYSRATGRENINRDTPENSCLHCGRSISAHIVRVVGDNDGNVQGCSECAENEYGQQYRNDITAALAVMQGAAVLEDGNR